MKICTRARPTVGIELELYNTEHPRLIELAGLNRSGWSDSSDGSLDSGRGGREFRFSGPVNWVDFQAKMLHETHQLARLSKFSFSSSDGKWLGPVEAQQTSGSTGLHMHLGYPEDITGMEVFGLMYWTWKMHEQIITSSWRDCPRWAMGSEKRYINGFAFMQYKGYDKTCGCNLSGINNSGRRTVEFRYGHGQLAQDIGALTRFVNSCKGAWDLAFNPPPAYDLTLGDVGIIPGLIKPGHKITVDGREKTFRSFTPNGIQTDGNEYDLRPSRDRTFPKIEINGIPPETPLQVIPSADKKAVCIGLTGRPAWDMHPVQLRG